MATADARVVTVGMADMIISRDPGEHLVTYALGSCLGVSVHDPVVGVGGLLHVMLPSGALDPDRARRNPFMFVDTGVPELFRACYRAGAARERMVIKVAGASGGLMDQADDHFQVGRRNMLTLRKLLWKNGIILRAEDVGGHLTSRTMTLEIATGSVRIWANGRDLLL
jgi:chemotaxis protein CheD